MKIHDTCCETNWKHLKYQFTKINSTKTKDEDYEKISDYFSDMLNRPKCLFTEIKSWNSV